MKKGQKVKIDIQVSKYETELKEGFVKDVISSKMGKDLFVVEVENSGVMPEYRLHYRFENELK